MSNLSSYINVKANTVSSDGNISSAQNISATNNITAGGDVDFDGNGRVGGNLTISGNTVTQNVTTLNIADPLIYLAANNYSSDVVDIGFAGNYYDGSTQRHAGLVRHAADGKFYLFYNYTPEPDDNVIDVSHSSYRVGTMNANIVAINIVVDGIDLKPLINLIKSALFSGVIPLAYSKVSTILSKNSCFVFGIYFTSFSLSFLKGTIL